MKAPFTFKNASSHIQGIFADAVLETLSESCGSCQAYDKVIVEFYRSLTGDKPEKADLSVLMKSLFQPYHVHFPVEGPQEVSSFYAEHLFVPVSPSMGSVMLVVPFAKKMFFEALSSSLYRSWPVVLIFVLAMAIVALVLSLVVCSLFSLLLGEINLFVIAKVGQDGR